MKNKRSEEFIFEGHRIVIQFPKKYSVESIKEFPFVIVQDGDYLFRKMESQVVMVGVEPIDRDNEYTPWPCEIVDEYCEGKADQYLDMIERLIEYLRSHYHVTHDNHQVGIAGGSYGALLSFYALLARPNIAGQYFLLSPSVWYPDFLSFIASAKFPERKYVFWYVGLDEGKDHPYIMRNMVPYSMKIMPYVREQLINNHSKFVFVTRAGAEHHHRYFKKYFKKALKRIGWL